MLEALNFGYDFMQFFRVEILQKSKSRGQEEVLCSPKLISRKFWGRKILKFSQGVEERCFFLLLSVQSSWSWCSSWLMSEWTEKSLQLDPSDLPPPPGVKMRAVFQNQWGCTLYVRSEYLLPWNSIWYQQLRNRQKPRWGGKMADQLIISKPCEHWPGKSIHFVVQNKVLKWGGCFKEGGGVGLQKKGGAEGI